VASVVPDLVILDLGLPDIHGLDVLKNLRTWSSIPLIILSVRSSEAEKVASFEHGADDYVVKPCGMQELLARSRAAMRRGTLARSAGPVISVGTLKLDFSTRRVTLDGRPVKLTPKEYRVLKALALQAGTVVTHEQILQEVWGPGHVADGHYLRILVRRLRQKIERDPVNPRILVTELGIGYRFETDEDATAPPGPGTWQ
jgi:two-component system KDP operon response regulator KdpE